MAARPSDFFAPARSGVYRAPRRLVPLREASAAAECAWIDVDVTAVKDKGQLLAAFAAALAFPPTFGGNWDALADSLQDLSWRRERGYVLHLQGAAALSQVLPPAWATALEILAASAMYWKERGTAFIVLADGIDGLPEFER